MISWQAPSRTRISLQTLSQRPREVMVVPVLRRVLFGSAEGFLRKQVSAIRVVVTGSRS